MRAAEARFVCWDFEGCGPHPLQVGVAVMDRFEIRPAFFSDLHAPKSLVIPAESPASHLDRDALARAPKLWELWPQLHPYWHCDAWVAHNLGTERKYTGAFALHPGPGWVDTLKVFRFAYPSLADYALGSLLRGLGLFEEAVRLSKQHPQGKGEEHCPVFDACGSLLLLREVCRQPGWEDVTIEQLSRLHPQDYYRKRQKNRVLTH